MTECGIDGVRYARPKGPGDVYCKANGTQFHRGASTDCLYGETELAATRWGINCNFMRAARPRAFPFSNLGVLRTIRRV